MNKSINTFRTNKSEYCHILDNRIVIANKEEINKEEYIENKESWHVKYVQNLYLFEIFATYFVIDNGLRHYQNQDWFKLTAILLIFGAVLFSVIWGRNKSRASVIYFKDITNVKYTGNSTLRTSFFRVYFTNKKGQEKVRVIPVYYKEKDNHDIALHAFKQSGLLKETEIING